MKNRKGMLWLIIIFILIMTLACCSIKSPSYTPKYSPSNSAPSKQCTISNPVSHKANLFNSLNMNDDSSTLVNDGTRCTKVSTSSYTDDFGIKYYKVTCSGKTGYVNTKWCK